MATVPNTSCFHVQSSLVTWQAYKNEDQFTSLLWSPHYPVPVQAYTSTVKPVCVCVCVCVWVCVRARHWLQEPHNLCYYVITGRSAATTVKNTQSPGSVQEEVSGYGLQDKAEFGFEFASGCSLSGAFLLDTLFPNGSQGPYQFIVRQGRIQRLSLGGGEVDDEAPRRAGFGEGVSPSPTGGGIWGGGIAPSPENFRFFPSPNCVFNGFWECKNYEFSS